MRLDIVAGPCRRERGHRAHPEVVLLAGVYVGLSLRAADVARLVVPYRELGLAGELGLVIIARYVAITAIIITFRERLNLVGVVPIRRLCVLERRRMPIWSKMRRRSGGLFFLLVGSESV